MYINPGEINGGHLGDSVSEHAEFRGQIQLIVGPMFSGKTTELMRRLRRLSFSNQRCVLVKYSRDDRYDSENVATHDKLTMPALKCGELAEISDAVSGYDVIGIDEGQFFPDIVSFAEDLANRGKLVIVAALDGTFQREGFPNVLRLLPLAESIVKLSAICMMCYREAAFTKRLGSEVEIELIGGADKYMAVCRSCHLKSTQKVNGSS